MHFVHLYVDVQNTLVAVLVCVWNQNRSVWTLERTLEMTLEMTLVSACIHITAFIIVYYCVYSVLAYCLLLIRCICYYIIGRLTLLTLLTLLTKLTLFPGLTNLLYK